MWLITILYLYFSSAYMYSEGAPPELYMTAISEVITVLEESRDYYFNDGEQTQFTCHGNEGCYIVYRPRDGSEEVVSHKTYDTAGRARVYMKLTARDNDTLLRCCRGHPLYYDTNTTKIEIRLIVKPRENRTDIIGFKVNGLTTSAAWNGGGWEHEYTYFSGEPLLVEVATGGRQYGDVTCRFEGTNVPSNLTTENIEKYLMKLKYILKIILYENQTNICLNCTASRLADAALFRSSIKFTLYNDPAYDPYVTGLSFGRIIMQYNRYGTNTVFYEYTAGDRLTFTCVNQSDYPDSHWEYNSDEVYTKYRDRGRTLKFELYPHVNSTTVAYTYYHTWVKVKLVRTEEVTPLTPVIDLAQLISAEKWKLGFAVTAAVAGVLVLAVVAVKFVCKRYATQEPSADAAAAAGAGETACEEHEEEDELSQHASDRTEEP